MSATDEPEDDLRPARRTDRLNLPIPGDAGPADYVSATGNLADAIDALSSTGFIGWQSGDIKASAATAPPDGWLRCNGQAIDRGVFATLFAAIGTAYGAGDGVNTFNVPDLRGRFAAGSQNPASLGLVGGEAAHTLDVNEMPAHGHSLHDPTHAHPLGDPSHGHSGYTDAQTAMPAAYVAAAIANEAVFTATGQAGNTATPRPSSNGGYWAGFTGAHSHNTASHGAFTGIWCGGQYTGVSVYANGSGWSHNNLPPFVNVNYFIKV